MIPFLEQTWFLWWLVAIFVILRWFHQMSENDQVEAGESLVKEDSKSSAIVAGSFTGTESR